MLVQRREGAKAVIAAMKINVGGKRGLRRPRKIWLDTIENGRRAVGVCVTGAEDRDD
jgi:hypothetical protein